MNEEGSWEECLETTASLRVSIDKGKIKSLIDTAVGRNLFLKENEIKESNVNYIFLLLVFLSQNPFSCHNKQASFF